MKKVLVTGASGFIGKHLCSKLNKLNWNVYGTVRKFDFHSSHYDFKAIAVDEINSNTNWGNALKNVDYIIHCAGKAHLINENDNFLATSQNT